MFILNVVSRLKRLQLLKNVLTETAPQVIGFREVRSRKHASTSLHRYQVSDLAAMLPGYEFVYQPAMTFQEGDELHQEGLAIFSSYPILKTGYIKLSRDASDSGDFHQRLLLRALVSTPKGKVNFFVTHLSLSRSARQRTMEEIGNHVNSFKEPCIIVGDFNAVFHEEAGDWASRHGLLDTWEALHPKKRGLTFSSWFPRSRIDYIFAKGLVPIQVSVEGQTAVRRDGLEPKGGIRNMKGLLYPSDHMFPFVKLRVGNIEQ